MNEHHEGMILQKKNLSFLLSSPSSHHFYVYIYINLLLMMRQINEFDELWMCLCRWDESISMNKWESSAPEISRIWWKYQQHKRKKKKMGKIFLWYEFERREVGRKWERDWWVKCSIKIGFFIREWCDVLIGKSLSLSLFY